MDKQQSQTPDTFGFKQLWSELKRRKFMVAAIIILGVAATAAYTASQVVTYRATSALLIENFIPNRDQFINPFGEGVAPDVIKANRILAESRPVREGARVRAQLALGEKDDPQNNVDY